MASKPADFKALFEFYYEFVKPLYSSVQIANHLPFEVLFELNAALDHISRHWHYGEPEDKAVDRAYSHLKRSCLDIFKLKAKQTTDEYNELRKIDTSIIDNGEFDREMVTLYEKIRTGAINARRGEGQTNKDDERVAAFDLWEPVYADCENFHNDFYLHDKVTWAHRKNVKRIIRDVAIGFVLGVVTSLVANYIWIQIGPTPTPPAAPTPAPTP